MSELINELLDELQQASIYEQIVETGNVLEVEENDERFLVTIGEHGSDFAIGFPIFKDAYSNLPLMFFGGGDQSTFKIGDKIEVIGFGSDYGIYSLTVNGEKWFCYDESSAKIINEIRIRDKEITLLNDRLEELQK